MVTGVEGVLGKFLKTEVFGKDGQQAFLYELQDGFFTPNASPPERCPYGQNIQSTKAQHINTFSHLLFVHTISMVIPIILLKFAANKMLYRYENHTHHRCGIGLEPDRLLAEEKSV